eukprot:TRINITY_DN2276_c0_g1_i2.p1 TRINITY_DN2276_c0_g1~~TRINITY_DN2276_c0_g1_i2.p1  ORF type:complete len:255 (+),score=56.03 TRINITY_DN2276_c0_g1_i2:149-913(+)
MEQLFADLLHDDETQSRSLIEPLGHNQNTVYYTQTTTDKENQEPSSSHASPYAMLQQILANQTRMLQTLAAIEKSLENGQKSPTRSPLPCSGLQSSQTTINAAMQGAINDAKPLKYWGECLHFVLRRPELFRDVIHWNSEGDGYWISNEEALHVILGSLKGSIPQRSRESMKSRFFVKSANALTKEENGLTFDLYENKKPSYTSSSLNYPRVKVEKRESSNQGRKRSISDEDEDEYVVEDDEEYATVVVKKHKM